MTWTSKGGRRPPGRHRTQAVRYRTWCRVERPCDSPTDLVTHEGSVDSSPQRDKGLWHTHRDCPSTVFVTSCPLPPTVDGSLHGVLLPDGARTCDVEDLGPPHSLSEVESSKITSPIIIMKSQKISFYTKSVIIFHGKFTSLHRSPYYLY